MMTYATKIFVLLGIIIGSAVATGCNTVEGVGKDIKSTGGAIEDAGD